MRYGKLSTDWDTDRLRCWPRLSVIEREWALVNAWCLTLCAATSVILKALNGVLT